MKNYAFCPISENKINEQVSRINGLITVLILLAIGLTENILWIAFLVIDFLFRSTTFSKYSVIGFASRSIAAYLGLKEKLINAGPKIFAARVGLLFTTTILVTSFFSLGEAAFVVAGLLALFSFLEGAFGICVACIIYPILYRLTYRTKFS